MTSVTDCSQHKFGHTDLHTQICKCTCTYGWPNRLVSGCKLQKKKKKNTAMITNPHQITTTWRTTCIGWPHPFQVSLQGALNIPIVSTPKQVQVINFIIPLVYCVWLRWNLGMRPEL